jgi:hypothetical protein
MNPDQYFDKMRFSCGKFMMSKTRIYLDTKYWIYLRDANRGNGHELSIKILNEFRRLVKSGKAICPLSAQIYSELLKQYPKELRILMAGLMDELSQQYCFINPLAIAGQEIITFIRNRESTSKGIPPSDNVNYVWTKVPFILGENCPSLNNLPERETELLQESFLNHLSNISLKEKITISPSEAPIQSFRDLAQQLNEGKDVHQEWKSFQDVYLMEIVGYLDYLREDLDKMQRFLFYKEPGQMVSSETSLKVNHAQVLSELIYHAFQTDTVGKSLPQIDIRAKIHAQIRFDKLQRFRENDFMDIGHAAWALPYCQYFFTEKRLAGIIEQTKLDLKYGAKVLTDENDILECLLGLD